MTRPGGIDSTTRSTCSSYGSWCTGSASRRLRSVTDHRAAIAGVFDRAASTYDATGVDFFSLVGATLVDDAGLSAGDRVLDVGCGRGAALFAAADAVGPAGTVHGFDLAPTMVVLTAAEAAGRGLANVQVEVMDAQEPTLPAAAYDAVLSSLVVFFLPDPLAGLRAWRAAVRAGGRLAITTFVGRNDERWSWLEDVFPDRDSGSSAEKDEEPDPFGSDESLHSLLAEAGFVDASSRVREHLVRFENPEHWQRWSWSHGMRTFWERIPESARGDAWGAARRHLERMRDEPDGLSLRMTVRYTTATAG